MLVLARGIDESIMIGDDIEIFVVHVGRNQVRLGIKAPKHTPVHRKEIYEKIQRMLAENIPHKK
ncbi:MAG: carbon storage regulator CsrA [Planctomycetota bacterium]|jgi:carbon storage regulator